MKSDSWVATLLAGAALGAVVAVACSNDSPGDADAATCNCPTAEPPLGGRIVRLRATGAIAANGQGTAAAGCNEGTLLGGSCRLMLADRRIALTEAGADLGGLHAYQCEWSSASPVANTAIAEAICLMPAQ